MPGGFLLPGTFSPKVGRISHLQRTSRSYRPSTASSLFGSASFHIHPHRCATYREASRLALFPIEERLRPRSTAPFARFHMLRPIRPRRKKIIIVCLFYFLAVPHEHLSMYTALTSTAIRVSITATPSLAYPLGILLPGDRHDFGRISDGLPTPSDTSGASVIGLKCMRDIAPSAIDLLL